MSDVTVIDCGSIVVIEPNTDQARTWIDENVGPDNGFQPSYPMLDCDRKYSFDIIYGMQQDGLTTEIDGREFTLQPAN